MENKVVVIDEDTFMKKCASACAFLHTDFMDCTGEEPPKSFIMLLPLVCAVITNKLFHSEEEKAEDASV